MQNKNIINTLMDKGVVFRDPDQVYISEEVSPDRIAGEGVVIYPGCRILGGETLIMEGTVLGYEGPVTVQDCQIGSKVELKGGFFRGATFLNGANLGAGAHVRQGCLLEEHGVEDRRKIG